ncbi:MAG: glycosyltransferase family 2 protein [Candidatus Binatia bacterium]|nr:glycosyltransferase family 2 protein [Candidatus Binatia bacterium]
MKAEISAVLPVYNEALNLEPLHRELIAVLERLGRPFEIVYVDDGSTDGSAELLDQFSSDDRVRVIHLARNYGQTAALAAGFDQATGDVVVTLDADGQNDPREIGKLLAEIDRGFDLVVGWRWPRQDPFWTRRLPSMFANWLIGRITGVRLHDYGCTLKAMRREVVSELRLYGEMHRFIPALAAEVGARIAEIRVRHRPRQAGKSKYGLSRTWKVLLDLVAVKFLTGYSTRPIQVFGSLGLICGLVGIAIIGALGFQRLVLGVPLANRPLVLLGILLTVVGIQFVSMGLLGELLVRTYHESQGKPIYRSRRASQSQHLR